MARLRKFCAYRRLERPYTRISKFREKSFVRVHPALKIVRFDMGDSKRKFTYELNLVSKTDLQIRQNAIESARQSSNRLLEKKLGKNDYFMKILIYPYHILRENPLAAGAGADRMSTGMQKSFGKPIGSAAQVRKGKSVVKLCVNKQHLKIARDAMLRFTHKLPNSYSVQIKENKV